MAREPLELGQHGEIVAIPQKRDEDGKWKKATHHRSAERWRSRVWFRGYDGVVREISRVGKTSRLATAKVEEALREQTSLGVAAGGLTPSMLVPDAGDFWLSQIKRRERGYSAETIDDYQRALKNHVKGEQSKIRGLTLRQVNDPQRLRFFLQDVADRRGTGAAKMARQVLSGVLWMAVGDGLFDTNALMMVKPIKANEPQLTARQQQHDHRRAYTDDEAEAVMAYAEKLAAQENVIARTRRKWQTTADMMAFMRGTAARIGEARRVRWDEMDLLTGWVLILGTKSAKSQRAVKMPQWLRDRMRERGARDGVEELVFPTPHHLDPSQPWDQSNANKAVRVVLDGAEMFWAIPHTWRRTAATKLEKAGWSPSRIADQLGHVQSETTSRFYLERDLMARGDARAAEVL